MDEGKNPAPTITAEVIFSRFLINLSFNFIVEYLFLLIPRPRLLVLY